MPHLVVEASVPSGTLCVSSGWSLGVSSISNEWDAVCVNRVITSGFGVRDGLCV